MEYSIYINKEDANKAEEEELNSFIRSVLENSGLELDDVWAEGAELDVVTKIKLRSFLAKFDVDIIHDGDRGYKIYVGDDVIAEWFKPRVVLKTDPQARKASQRTYYEMMIKCSSVFEEFEEQEEE